MVAAVASWFTHIQSRHFLLTARVGALAGDPLASFNTQVNTDYDTADFYSNNAFLLSTDDALKTEYVVKGLKDDRLNVFRSRSSSSSGSDSSGSSSSSSSTSTLPEDFSVSVIYTWQLIKPVLSGLGMSISNGGTSSGGDIYFRVSPGRTVAETPGLGEVKPGGGRGGAASGSGGSASGSMGEDVMMKMNQEVHYEMSLDVTFVPCPEDACLHGTCALLPGNNITA